ncbi:uracil-DNA glycosylase-like [Lineus longissimus]|uniref:uracil-DNA glycosylase-like n=1 Tax=Lineus longissimus TaxID=88925 RepID=UPI002B4D5D64
MPPRRAPKRLASAVKKDAVEKSKPVAKKAKVAPKKKPAPKKAKMSEAKKVKPKVKAVAAAGDGPTDCTPIDLLSLLTEKTWKDALADEFKKPYFKELEKKLSAEYAAGKQIFPPRNLIFTAYNLTPLNEIKVVILGQDPYHDDRQAHGLAFSVPHGIHPLPPSLKNMFTELENDEDIVGFHTPPHGCLTAWTEEGVFLLNASLTVEAHKPNSHSKFGWQQFTDATIKAISDNTRHVIFLLLGNFAQKKRDLIDPGKHYIVEAAHPSPLSIAKFKNCHCFSQVNKALKVYSREPVDWTLEHILD